MRPETVAIISLAIAALGQPLSLSARETSAATEEIPLSEQGIEWERSIGRLEDLGKKKGLFRRLAGQKQDNLFLRPYGVAFFDNGLLLTDPAAHHVILIRDGKELLTSPEGLFDSPIGIVPCRNGFVVTDSREGAVALLEKDLSLDRWLLTGLNRPTGIACSNDRLFVSETGAHRIVVMERDDQRREIGHRGEGPAEFNFPTALAIQGTHLWVADSLNFRIQQLDTETGTFRSSFGRLGDAPGEMPRVKGLAVDTEGRIWFSDGLLNSVDLYTQSGEYLLHLHQGGSPLVEFSFPAGIAAGPDGKIAIVDSLNRMVHLLSAGSIDQVSGPR